MAKKDQFALTELQNNVAEQKLKIHKEVVDNIIVLPELMSYIPALSTEEVLQLEANILQEGCRDALILWEKDKKYIIVDGHNRYKICTLHKLPFKYEIKQFADIEEVRLWMLQNQLGKRNLTEVQKSYLRGKQYELEKKKQGRPTLAEASNKPAQKTVDRLAEEHKVSDKTIKNDFKYAQIIDALATYLPSLKAKILNQTIDLPKTAFVFLEDLSTTDLKNVAESLDKGIAFKDIVQEYEAKNQRSKPVKLPKLAKNIHTNPKKNTEITAVNWQELHKIHELLAEAIKTQNQLLLKEIVRMLKNIT